MSSQTNQSLLLVGGAMCWVRYVYTPEEKARGPESRLAGPAEPAQVILLEVLVNGTWVDVDVLSDATRTDLQARIEEEYSNV